MIINNFYLFRLPFTPSEYDSPLIVNPDAVKPFKIATQLFKSV